MLLQERNYELRFDEEDEAKDSVMSDATGHSSYKKTSRNSFDSRLRRSTFDLSSVNSLATSCSDSSSYSLTSPTRKSSTMRYRGQSSSSTSTTQEGAASQALMQLIANQEKMTALQEAHQAIEAEGETADSAQNVSSISKGSSDRIESFIQYFLEVIFFGCLIVPFLHMTIAIERCLRTSFGELHRNLELAFTTLRTPSYSIEEEPIEFERRGLYHSPKSREGLNTTTEAVYSSSSDDNSEEDEDSWGHFADFQDELADESSFIPSCSIMPIRTRTETSVAVSPTCIATLETLAECQEEDDEGEEDWSF